jgi:DNA-binding transcriptional LysR family regulator
VTEQNGSIPPQDPFGRCAGSPPPHDSALVIVPNPAGDYYPSRELKHLSGAKSAAVSASLSKLLGRLRFRHLLLLVAIDEHRNLHRAAAAVHLAQPSASGQVHDLESLFGSPLFDRLPTGMQPTRLGGVVLAFARCTLGDLKRLAGDLDDLRAGRDGDLVIGTTTDLLPDFVAHAMAEMKQHRPMLAVKLLGGSNEEIIDHLIEGQVDIAVGYLCGFKHSEVDYSVIRREPLCILARKLHPLCGEPRLSVSALENAAWIFHPQTGFMSQVVQQFFLCASMKPPANILESSSLTVTMNLLLRSDLITILPEGVARNHLRERQLVRLPVPVHDYLIQFGMLTRRDEPPNPIVAEFGQILRRYGDTAEQSPTVSL